jgi:hypothetical protein
MRSLGEGLLDRLCAAGIVNRPGIDRNAVKEISIFKKLIPVSVSILFLSFSFRAIMYAFLLSPTPHLVTLSACTCALPSATLWTNLPSAGYVTIVKATPGNRR